MTMPHLMNCPHDESGWCLDCVAELGNEAMDLRKQVSTLKAERAGLEAENAELKQRAADHADFHEAWAYAKDNPSECKDGYQKGAFGSVLFWLRRLQSKRREQPVAPRV